MRYRRGCIEHRFKLDLPSWLKLHHVDQELSSYVTLTLVKFLTVSQGSKTLMNLWYELVNQDFMVKGIVCERSTGGT